MREVGFLEVSPGDHLARLRGALRFGFDPATASSIFLTTATDVVSMGMLLGLATILVSLNAMRAGLSFPPGTRESYSNTGYSLLAAIIEQVSGTTYDAYVNENLLADGKGRYAGIAAGIELE